MINPANNNAYSTIKVNVNPQDSMVSEPVTIEVDSSMMEDGFSNSRTSFQISADRDPAVPDKDGNYLYSPDEHQFEQVNAFVHTNQVIGMHEKLSGHANLAESDGKKLQITSGGKNAFYYGNSRTIRLGGVYSDKLEKNIETSQSADVIAHEAGHAVFDRLKPNYYELRNSPESNPMDEAFSDCTSILHALQYDENIEGLFKDTNGDLSKDNRVALVSEEFGYASSFIEQDPNNDGRPYVRNATNDIKYRPPDELSPENETDTEALTSGCHRFSRIFTGAFYDILCSIAEDKISETGSFKEGMKEAAEVSGTLLVKGVDFASPANFTFKQVAECMLTADETIYDGKYRDHILQAMEERNILPAGGGDSEFLPPLRIDSEIKDEKDALELMKNEEISQMLIADDLKFTKAEIEKDSFGNTIIKYFNTEFFTYTDLGIVPPRDSDPFALGSTYTHPSTLFNTYGSDDASYKTFEDLGIDPKPGYEKDDIVNRYSAMTTVIDKEGIIISNNHDEIRDERANEMLKERAPFLELWLKESQPSE
jgi:hypothetical protein